jgi:hypothetical protein
LSIPKQPDRLEDTVDFIEEPISYEEARRAISKFEHAYKILSASLFSEEGDVSGQDLEICDDVLFEWRSHYEFVRDVDSDLAKAAAEHETPVYSLLGRIEERACPRGPEERKQAVLGVAA